ncbi:hypothetical protein EX30DRAFT_114181 [Ascodesmis nigricans]|uniref:Uncharacterized protein n=1 Tax=Ascodesmis nigricans TaxID=341454 RepID=A0A4S2MSN9_9PEZI|nr:hypothetical protein EX30DRAFT_114181 [Ascodesmis nigricans]
MARSIASRPGASSRSPLTSATSMILPFALTLTTAAIASAGLYFFSDSSTTQPKPYLPSDTEEERPPPLSRRSRKPPRTKAAILRQQDADLASGFSDIPEEDTDAIVESHREEEERKQRRRTQLGMTFARMKGRVGEVLETVADEGLYDEEEAAEERRRREEEERRRKREEMMMEQRREQQEIMLQREREIDPSAVPLPSDSPVVNAAGSTIPVEAKAAGHYIPPPKRLKPIVIVVQERKATQGHESDDSFEEALSPTVSPYPLFPYPPHIHPHHQPLPQFTPPANLP